MKEMEEKAALMPGAAAVSEPALSPSGQRTNLAALYCHKFRVSPARFLHVFFWRTLYPHARWIGIPLAVLLPDLFLIDRDFITRVGLVESIEEYIGVEIRYRRSVTCFSPLRRSMRLRVSTRRVREMVDQLLDDGSRRRRKSES